MTHSQEIKPGRELDREVALKVMGWKVQHDIWYSPEYKTQQKFDRPPQYSTDIAAAWKVVDRLEKTLDGKRWTGDFKLLLCVDAWEAGWSFWETGRGTWFEESTASTAPHAICLAALKAVGAP